MMVRVELVVNASQQRKVTVETGPIYREWTRLRGKEDKQSRKALGKRLDIVSSVTAGFEVSTVRLFHPRQRGVQSSQSNFRARGYMSFGAIIFKYFEAIR